MEHVSRQNRKRPRIKTLGRFVWLEQRRDRVASSILEGCTRHDADCLLVNRRCSSHGTLPIVQKQFGLSRNANAPESESGALTRVIQKHGHSTRIANYYQRRYTFGMITGTFMSTGEVAAFLGVTTARVRQFVMKKRLNPVKKFSSMLLFDACEVHKFAEIQRKVGRPNNSKNGS